MSSNSSTRARPGEAAGSLSPVERLARARKLEEECFELAKKGNRVEAQQALKLREVKQTRAWAALGYGSLRDFAMKVFGWGSSKVGKIFKLLDRLQDQPLLRQAFLSGGVDYTKAVEVSRAIEREPDQEPRWLAQAQTGDSEQIALAIGEALGEERKVRRVLRLDSQQRAVLEDAQRALMSEGFADLDLTSVVVELARRVLEGGKAGSSAYRVILSQDPMTGRITQETRAGTVVVSPEVLARVLPGAEVQLASGKVTRHIPLEAQRAVTARSHGRCEVPGCSELACLEFHHLLGWRNGHHSPRIFHLCYGHHRACHEGALLIEGSWEEGVVFRLADGTVLGTAGGSECRTAAESASECRTAGESGRGTAAESESESDRRTALPCDPSSGPRRRTRLENERNALATLRSLDFSPQRARELVIAALVRNPELADDAGLLVAEALRAS
ncbi:MAG: hypothetical protein AB7N76_28720 [Planctomycetota bacterium]